MTTSRKSKPAVHDPPKPVARKKVAAKPAPAPKEHQRAHKAAGNPPVAVPPAAGAAAAAPPAVSPALLVLAPPAVTGIATAYAGLVGQPPVYDPASGLAAFTALGSNRAAIAKVQVAHVDVQAAALAALGVYGFVAQVPVLKAQFQAMGSAGLFSTATLENLKTASFAALYAFNQAEADGAFATDAMVPAALIAQATAVEKRMQARCEYVFAGDPAVSPLLDMLRPGKGYNDLANDLLGYASIYAHNKAKVAAVNDPNYLATDLAAAESFAGQILAYLTAAMGPQAKAAYGDLQQSWTLLLAIYGEVQAVGLTLLRFDPKRQERFPSLTSMARATPAKKKAKAAAPVQAAAPVAAAAKV